jgi:hypothetical protein
MHGIHFASGPAARNAIVTSRKVWPSRVPLSSQVQKVQAARGRDGRDSALMANIR